VWYARGTALVRANISQAEQYIAKAQQVYTSDLYARALIEIAIFKLQQPNAQVTTIAPPAIALVAEITASNPSDYRNWLAGARLYQTLAIRQVAGAAAKSAELYTTACKHVTGDSTEAQHLAEICYAGQTVSDK
jgi:hypothetical protein